MFKKLGNYFKHIFKDPINSIEEADQRKKELKPLLFVSIGVMVAFVALGALVDFLSFFGVIGLAGVVVSLFLMGVCNSIKKRFKFLTCNKCKKLAEITTQEDFDKYVTYEVIDSGVEFAKPFTVDGDPGMYKEIRLDVTVWARVALALKCPECGDVKYGTFRIEPLKLERKEYKVPVVAAADFVALARKEFDAILEAFDEDETAVPFTITSIHHPDYENRTKPQIGQTKFGNVVIKYHRTLQELVDGYFLRKELNYDISEKEVEQKVEQEA